MIGRVVSTKMNNTAVVLIERVAMHPLYKKTFVRSKRYLVDAKIAVAEGDMVEIVKVRPISKNKHWAITKVVGKDLAEITEEKLKAEAEEIVAEVMPEISKPESSEKSEDRRGLFSDENQKETEAPNKKSKKKKEKK